MRKIAVPLSRTTMLAALLGLLSFFGVQRGANAAGCVGHDRPVFGISNASQNDLMNVDLVDTQNLSLKSAGYLAGKPCSSDTPNAPRHAELITAAILTSVYISAPPSFHRLSLDSEALDAGASSKVGERPPR